MQGVGQCDTTQPITDCENIIKHQFQVHTINNPSVLGSDVNTEGLVFTYFFTHTHTDRQTLRE